MCTCMYSVSISFEYVYEFMRIIVLSVCITCGSSCVNFSIFIYEDHCFECMYYLWEFVCELLKTNIMILL